MLSSGSRPPPPSEHAEKEDRLLQWSGGDDESLCWRLTTRFLCFESDKCEGNGANPSLLSSEEEEEVS